MLKLKLRYGKRIVQYIAFLLIYVLMCKNYVESNICVSKNSFLAISVIYWVLVYLLRTEKKVEESNILVVTKIFAFSLSPLVSFYISDFMWNPYVGEMEWVKIFINYLLFFGIQMVLFVFSRNMHFAAVITLFMGFVYGLINYYILLFKGNPLMPSDIFAIGTAMQVVGNYTFTLSDTIIIAMLLLMSTVYVWKILKGDTEKRKLKSIISRGILGIVWVIVFVYAVIFVDWKKILNVTLDAWTPKLTYYENGGILSFLMESQAMQVDKPDGYNVQIVENILAEYSGEEAKSEITPSVIVIMNESLCDLSVFEDGDFSSYLSEFYAIDNYIMRGNSYVSVKGGGTCNSEFEFLTGCSMFNLPSAVYPYQSYSLNSVYSLPKIFADNGYKTIAIHPAQESNWNRKSVYNQLGFEEFISIEDMTNVEHIRNYASDKYNYEKIIEIYENTTEPLFLFNITLQNHGGYSDIENLTGMSVVEVEDRFKGNKELITYLTLIKESDNAFSELISYFSQQDKPVIVCMFGDHLPSFTTSYYELFDIDKELLEDKQKLFCTPYIVWSNFEMAEMNVYENTSLNYLGINLIELAGISTPYTQYMIDMQSEIPVVNVLGYKTLDGEWHEKSEDNQWLSKYEMLQYYMLFDREEVGDI